MSLSLHFLMVPRISLACTSEMKESDRNIFLDFGFRRSPGFVQRNLLECRMEDCWRVAEVYTPPFENLSFPILLLRSRSIFESSSQFVLQNVDEQITGMDFCSNIRDN